MPDLLRGRFSARGRALPRGYRCIRWNIIDIQFISGSLFAILCEVYAPRELSGKELNSMLPTPKKFTLVAGCAEGGTKLTAFDKALLAAGIGNLNLLRVSSILPPSCEYVEKLSIPPGSLTPTAYGSIISDVPGETIAAAIGVGFSENDYGVIMEFGGKCTKEEAEEKVAQMVREAFETRGIKLVKVMVKGCEHKVEKIGCAFAAAALWY